MLLRSTKLIICSIPKPIFCLKKHYTVGIEYEKTHDIISYILYMKEENQHILLLGWTE